MLSFLVLESCRLPSWECWTQNERRRAAACMEQPSLYSIIHNQYTENWHIRRFFYPSMIFFVKRCTVNRPECRKSQLLTITFVNRNKVLCNKHCKNGRYYRTPKTYATVPISQQGLHLIAHKLLLSSCSAEVRRLSWPESVVG